MTERFPFGQYTGKSVALVALTDYPYLNWVQPKVRNVSLRTEIETVRKALNSFKSQGKCHGIKDCPATPTQFSIAWHDGLWLIEDAYAFCPSNNCWNATGYDGARTSAPIKYDAMLRFSLGGVEQQPKRSVKEFQELLNTHAGFTGKKTEGNCQIFIDDMVRKHVPQPPQDFPEYRRLRQYPN